LRLQLVCAALAGAAAVGAAWSYVESRRRPEVVEKTETETVVAPQSPVDARIAELKRLTDNDDPTIEDLVNARAGFRELESREGLSVRQRAAIASLSTGITGRYVGLTRELAKYYADRTAKTRGDALARYAAAEDVVRHELLEAKTAKNKGDEEACTITYKALLVDSDEYARRELTPAVVESYVWTDLLSGEVAGRWTKSPPGAFQIENGVLTASPGVFGVLDQTTDDLRHFVLEMEFSVEGVVTMLFHVSPAPQNPDNRLSHSYDLVAGPNALAAGRSYLLRATYVGSDLAIEFPDMKGDGAIAAWRAEPSWAKLRRGGIAFLVPQGGRIKVTRMRIKDLR
jgi:hypothetical protein